MTRQSLSLHGDPIERAYSDFLGRALPHYCEYWSHFVGNDGSSQLIRVEGLSSDDTTTRAIVNQHSYTCVESAIAAHICVEDVERLAASSSEGQVLTAHDFLALTSQLFAFYAHLGRIRDLVAKVGTRLKLPDLALPLESYYQLRNNVLHEARLPLVLVGGHIGVVPPASAADELGHWAKDKLWSDPALVSPKDVGPLLRETLDGMLVALNDAFAKVHSRLMQSSLRTVADWLQNPPQVSDVATLPSGSAAAVIGESQFTKEDLRSIRVIT